jgi:hypothetical protein
LVPQTNALTKLRHSPLAAERELLCRADDATGRSEQTREPFDTLERAVPEVDRDRREQEFEVPRDGRKLFVGLGAAPVAGVDRSAAARAGAVGTNGGR